MFACWSAGMLTRHALGGRRRSGVPKRPSRGNQPVPQPSRGTSIRGCPEAGRRTPRINSDALTRTKHRFYQPVAADASTGLPGLLERSCRARTGPSSTSTLISPTRDTDSPDIPGIILPGIAGRSPRFTGHTWPVSLHDTDSPDILEPGVSISSYRFTGHPDAPRCTRDRPNITINRTPGAVQSAPPQGTNDHHDGPDIPGRGRLR